MPTESSPPTGQELTEEQYRQLCKQVRQYQQNKGRGKKRAKPILKPIGDVVTSKRDLTIQQQPVDWDEIKTGTPFALDPNATVIYTKAGVNRALCLNTMTSLSVGGALVYRIFF